MFWSAIALTSYVVGLFLFTYARKLVARRFIVGKKLRLGLSDWGIYLIAMIVTADQVNYHGRLAYSGNGGRYRLVTTVPSDPNDINIRQFFSFGEVVIWPFIIACNLIAMPFWASYEAIKAAWRWTKKI
jgi:hypothetical protein